MHRLTDTVDSLLFVVYQFSWFSWVPVNHEIKCPTKKFSYNKFKMEQIWFSQRVLGFRHRESFVHLQMMQWCLVFSRGLTNKL